MSETVEQRQAIRDNYQAGRFLANFLLENHGDQYRPALESDVAHRLLLSKGLGLQYNFFQGMFHNINNGFPPLHSYDNYMTSRLEGAKT